VVINDGCSTIDRREDSYAYRREEIYFSTARAHGVDILIRCIPSSICPRLERGWLSQSYEDLS
jgi:hypothetical protein